MHYTLMLSRTLVLKHLWCVVPIGGCEFLNQFPTGRYLGGTRLRSFQPYPRAIPAPSCGLRVSLGTAAPWGWGQGFVFQTMDRKIGKATPPCLSQHNPTWQKAPLLLQSCGVSGHPAEVKPREQLGRCSAQILRCPMGSRTRSGAGGPRWESKLRAVVPTVPFWGSGVNIEALNTCGHCRNPGMETLCWVVVRSTQLSWKWVVMCCWTLAFCRFKLMQ